MDKKLIPIVVALSLSSAQAVSAEKSIYCFPTKDLYSVDSIATYGTRCICEEMQVRPEQVKDLKQTTDGNMVADVVVTGNTLSVELIMFYPDYDLIMAEVML